VFSAEVKENGTLHMSPFICLHGMRLGLRSNTTYYLAEAVGFFPGVKNPEHAFLRKGSKAVGPVSYIYGTLKIPCGFRGSRTDKAKVAGHFSPEAFLPR
jgi:hypothetical protein